MPDMQDKGFENGGGHQEAHHARSREKAVCPFCGAGDQVIPIHYGLPTHENSQKAWRFSNCYQAFTWWRDRDLLGLEKMAPDRYRLDARLLRSQHRLELALPAGCTVEAEAWTIPIDPRDVGGP